MGVRKGDANLFSFQRVAAGNRPAAVTVADLNKDGFLDIVTANGNSSNVSVLLGNGNGTFQPQQLYPTASSGPNSVALADLNGDGFLDIVVALDSSAASVLLGNGDGTFQPQQRFDAGFGSNSIAAVDVNGDGVADLVTANRVTHDVSRCCWATAPAISNPHSGSLPVPLREP
jgi:hypothetical protein